jgi:hypothetical protein
MYKKQYGFITIFYDVDDSGKKTIKKMRFIGNSKDEYDVEGNIELEENDNGQIDTFGEVLALLRGLPEGSNLKAIIDNINTNTFTEEQMQMLEELSNATFVTKEEAVDIVNQAIAKAEQEYNATHEAGAAEDDVNGGGADLDD